MSPNLPPAAVTITHPVADFDRWMTGFESHEPARRAAGMLGHHVNRSIDDPNLITIYLALSDVDKAKAFTESADLGATMQSFGVAAPPVISWMQPVREAIVWDRQLPAFMLNHRVADFDKWLAGYDAAGTIQKANGIIGHAANRSLDDPQMITVYHQAESLETLEAFLGNTDLKAAMESAGVISAPEVTFHTGGWAKNY